MDQHSYLIIHGLGGSGPDHWQSWLCKVLRQQNYHVCYPTFSNYDLPDKDVWLDELYSAVSMIPQNHTFTVISHSLGCLLWLHYAAATLKRRANRVVLVAPPSPTTILHEAKTFFPIPLNGKDVSRVADETLFIHSTNDPYCSIAESENYLKLGVPSITLPNMGHINTESGLGKWPWILDLCLNIDIKRPGRLIK